MRQRHWAHIVALAALAAAFAAAVPAAASEPAAFGAEQAPAAGGSARGADGASAAAVAYLQARAAAVTAADPAAGLAPYLAAGSALARTEAKIAAGTSLRYQDTGRAVDSATCKVTVLDVQPADDGDTTSVGARAITTFTWRTAAGKTGVEASGIDHTLLLTWSGDRWVVCSDAYVDDMRAACLEAAGASRSKVRAAARAVEQSASPLSLPKDTATRSPLATRRYSDIIDYDRPAAQDYGDTYALSYNATFTRFAGADCANFASQCARAGSMPQSSGAVTSGWWYSKGGTSSPTNDTYSLSWINVAKQMSYWNGRRTDWETSAGVLSRGDFIYYDWTGDGVWDHVAVVAGTNSAGQKVIDAHTTDHYRVFWKLGTSSTKYKYARVRASWVI
jgi:cell wall-associated NlpC family hydrolase